MLGRPAVPQGIQRRRADVRCEAASDCPGTRGIQAGMHSLPETAAAQATSPSAAEGKGTREAERWLVPPIPVVASSVDSRWGFDRTGDMRQEMPETLAASHLQRQRHLAGS